MIMYRKYHILLIYRLRFEQKNKKSKLTLKIFYVLTNIFYNNYDTILNK
jgi:hypothetical protein